MAADSGGELARRYSKCRRGYDASVIDWLANALGLDSDATVIDLGCGTGQLAIPMSAHARAVVGVDPEPRCLRVQRPRAFGAHWVGHDSDPP